MPLPPQVSVVVAPADVALAVTDDVEVKLDEKAVEPGQIDTRKVLPKAPAQQAT
mgnify:CR=1 FL=1